MPQMISFARKTNTVQKTRDLSSKSRVIWWRRERDSNPRYGSPYTRFPVVRLRPAQPSLHGVFAAPLLSYNNPMKKARYIFVPGKIFWKTSCFFMKTVYNVLCSRGISTVGSAQRSQCWGQEFESPMLHHQRNLFCLPGQERFSCCFVRLTVI